MQPKFCTKCGNPLKGGDKFCRRCGAPVKKTGLSSDFDSANNNNSPYYSQSRDMFGQYDLSQNNRDNPEGTVLLGGVSSSIRRKESCRKAKIGLALDEMLRGGTKVVDFGTGKKYELQIPAGLSPGKILVVSDTGIIDPDTGTACVFELTVTMA